MILVPYWNPRLDEPVISWLKERTLPSGQAGQNRMYRIQDGHVTLTLSIIEVWAASLMREHASQNSEPVLKVESRIIIELHPSRHPHSVITEYEEYGGWVTDPHMLDDLVQVDCGLVGSSVVLFCESLLIPSVWVAETPSSMPGQVKVGNDKLGSVTAYTSQFPYHEIPTGNNAALTPNGLCESAVTPESPFPYILVQQCTNPSELSC